MNVSFNLLYVALVTNSVDKCIFAAKRSSDVCPSSSTRIIPNSFLCSGLQLPGPEMCYHVSSSPQLHSCGSASRQFHDPKEHTHDEMNINHSSFRKLALLVRQEFLWDLGVVAIVKCYQWMFCRLSLSLVFCSG